MTKAEHVDVLIIGAGLSGIGAAAHLAKDLPGTSYVVLERRAVSGGTWDLFRYPGVRSDSDMHTLGYRFRPWRGNVALADGQSILDYVRDTAREYGVDEHVRYGHRVVAAAWDSPTARWTVTAEVDGVTREITADFLWACSGYYDYDEGYTPQLRGPGPLPRAGRAPAALARGPRLHRQARRRDRLRRDRGDARPGAGRGRRRPRDDAAALADLRRLGAGQRLGQGAADPDAR